MPERVTKEERVAEIAIEHAKKVQKVENLESSLCLKKNKCTNTTLW